MEQYLRELYSDRHAEEIESALRLRASDIDQAVEQLEDFAQSESKVANFALGDLFLYGWYGVQIDQEKGEHLLKEAMRLGSIEGAYRLGCHFHKTSRLKEAIEVFERIAEQDYPPASYRLGKILEGACTKDDEKKARAFYDHAARLGHIPALKSLAKLNIKSGSSLAIMKGLYQYLTSIFPHYRQLKSDRSSDKLRQ